MRSISHSSLSTPPAIVMPTGGIVSPDDSEILMFAPRTTTRAGSMLPLLSTMGSRMPRLEDSAGLGLRRSVLLRNAMLSSLEQERIQLIADSKAELVSSQSSSQEPAPSPEVMQEAEWFDSLLSELSGHSVSQVSNQDPIAESEDACTSLLIECRDEDDFVRLDHGPLTENEDSNTDKLQGNANYRAHPAVDSGFAEHSTRPISVISFCQGYPNVCPYPSVSSLEITSSEELPALVDDDSDPEDDDDDNEDNSCRHTQLITSPIMEPTRDAELLSCPLSPDIDRDTHTPVINIQIHSYDIKELFSPGSSRPTSPESSASSKGGVDRSSPPLESQGLTTIPTLTSLSLQSCSERSLRHIADPSHHTESASCSSGHRHPHFELYQPTPRLASVDVSGHALGVGQHSYFPSLFGHGLTSHDSSMPSGNDDSIVLHWSSYR